MVKKNNSSNYVLIGVAIFAICIATFTYVQAYAESPCSEKVIKNHILSLEHKYTLEEKEALYPIIKQWLVDNGIC